MTVNNKIPISCKTILLIGQRATVHRSIARYRTVDRWPYFHWVNKSRDIDVTMPVYNKTVIDWVRGQQQFCLKGGRICYPKAQAHGNRSVRGLKKSVVV